MTASEEKKPEKRQRQEKGNPRKGLTPEGVSYRTGIGTGREWPRREKGRRSSEGGGIWLVVLGVFLDGG